MLLEEIVDERYDDDDGTWRRRETQARHALDETGDEGGGEVGGGQEGVEQPEEAGAVAHVEEVAVEEGVEFCEEVGVVEVFGGDQVEERV